MEYEIKRETSLYNKSMKWHLVGVSQLGKVSSWHKTRKEAEYQQYKNEVLTPEKYRTA